MNTGAPWSDGFVKELEEKEFRDEYVADQIRVRIASLIRALREQKERGWSQAELGRQMGKPQSVISRLEDPDYGKLSVQTLLEVAAAFDLPLWIDIPEWEAWLRLMKDVPTATTRRRGFDIDHLSSIAHSGGPVASISGSHGATVIPFLGSWGTIQGRTITPQSTSNKETLTIVA
jgi:transcriptional regulator with XRE-family HTH domain